MVEFKKAPETTDQDGATAAREMLPDWPDYLPEPGDTLVYWITGLVLLAILLAGLRASRAVARARAGAGAEPEADAPPKARQPAPVWPPAPQSFETKDG